jgi:hypothetical protein
MWVFSTCGRLIPWPVAHILTVLYVSGVYKSYVLSIQFFEKIELQKVTTNQIPAKGRVPVPVPYIPGTHRIIPYSYRTVHHISGLNATYSSNRTYVLYSFIGGKSRYDQRHLYTLCTCRGGIVPGMVVQSVLVHALNGMRHRLETYCLRYVQTVYVSLFANELRPATY